MSDTHTTELAPRLKAEGPDAGVTLLTPEQQLRNVAAAMLRYSEVKRTHNGRGKSSTYAANADTLAQTGRQLAEMVLAYLAGEPKPVAAGDSHEIMLDALQSARFCIGGLRADLISDADADAAEAEVGAAIAKALEVQS